MTMNRITNEIAALKIMFNRYKYYEYQRYFKNMELEEEHRLVFETLGDYFEENKEADDADLVDFTLYFGLKHPLAKNKDMVMETLDTLAHAEVGEATITTIMKKLILKHFVADIINELTPVLDDTADDDVIEEVYELLGNYESSVDHLVKPVNPEDKYVTHNLTELLNSEVIGVGLAWRLHCLNYDIGPLRGGCLGHIFARPDTGKTTMIASEISFMASQLENDEIIVWFNNEEKGNKVMLRIMSAVTGLSKASIALNPEEAERLFKELGGDRIKVVDKAMIDIHDIERELSESNVRVVVCDQSDKFYFRGGGDMAEHLRIKQIYVKLRELGKEYGCDIITVGQADNAAEGAKWLRLNNMDASKVGKPGELDFAIGIGLDPNGPEYARYISVCKNKMKDGRHGHWTTSIDVMAARYLDKEPETTPDVQTIVQQDGTQPFIPLAAAA